MNDQINLNQEALVINFVSPDSNQGGDDENYRITMRNRTFGGTSTLKLEIQNDNTTTVQINEIRFSIDGREMQNIEDEFPLTLEPGQLKVMDEVFIPSESFADLESLMINIEFKIQVPVNEEEKSGQFTIEAFGEAIAA